MKVLVARTIAIAAILSSPAVAGLNSVSQSLETGNGHSRVTSTSVPDLPTTATLLNWIVQYESEEGVPSVPRELGISTFDRFMSALSRGDRDSAEAIMHKKEQAGLRLFLNGPRTQCLRCHNGPLFTNNGVHGTRSDAAGG